MSYEVIKGHREVGQLQTLCGALGVSVSGYYAWRKRPASPHQQRDAALLVDIRRVYQAGRGVYGSPPIHAALRQAGEQVGRKRVARLMRQAGLHSRRAVKRRVRTTDSRHARPLAPNLLQRDFSAAAPNQKWVGDIVGIWTAEGWLYLAAILDTYSWRIVGWAMSALRDEDLVSEALRMALTRRVLSPQHALIHHTDRGSQYAAQGYRALLQQHAIQLSMST
jgi:transposase InsO family protein